MINGTIHYVLYKKILKENVRPLLCDLKLEYTVMQQDNDPKQQQAHLKMA